MAEEFAQPEWETDVAAFKVLNERRNGMVHRGVRNPSTHVLISSDDISTLEDIVERYLCLAFFGDSRVYQSRWRPKRSRPA